MTAKIPKKIRRSTREGGDTWEYGGKETDKGEGHDAGKSLRVGLTVESNHLMTTQTKDSAM
jgi:hypothetical protein